MLKRTAGYLVLLSFLMTGFASANEADPRVRLFREYGLGLGGGVFILEKSTGREFDVMATYGADLYMEAFGYKAHQAILRAGYYRPIETRTLGSEQVQVSTSYHLLDVALGYTGHWLFFLTDVQMGLSMAIVSAQTALYDLGQPALGTSGDQTRYEFPNRTLVDRNRTTGLSNGLLVNVGLGVDAGKLLMHKPRMLEFRIVTEYVRRDDRNEILVSYMWSFWPTALW